MGATLDKIDQCCMVHDNCYGEAEQPPCHLPLRKPYVIHYSWSWDEKHKRAYCCKAIIVFYLTLLALAVKLRSGCETSGQCERFVD